MSSKIPPSTPLSQRHHLLIGKKLANPTLRSSTAAHPDAEP
ncbi:hypothetical protein [Janthinobacterium sp. B9-8]|nr:hypothetical protein [Janthinobacterium sp. B9-8]